jgi:hypothetical protein
MSGLNNSKFRFVFKAKAPPDRMIRAAQIGTSSVGSPW